MEFLVVGGVIFWLLMLFAACLLIASVVYESLWGVSVVVITIAILHFLFAFDVSVHLPWYGWLLSILAYAAIGTLWSVYKFYVVYRDKVREIAEQCGDRTPDERRRFIEQHSPKPFTMKESILSWIAYWPVSVLIYFLSDFLRHAAEIIYEWFSGIYEGIARRIRESFIDMK